MRLGLRPGGLRARIISWFFIPTVILLVAVGLLTFYANDRMAADLVMERNQELTRLLTEQLSLQFKQHAQPLQGFLAAYPDVYDHDLAARQAQLRQDIGRLSLFDGGVVLLDPSAKVIAADRQPLSVLGEDWSSLAFIGRARTSLEPAFSDILPLAPGGDPAIAVAVPALDMETGLRGLAVGVFRLETRMSALYRSVLNLGLYTSGPHESRLTYIVDSAGRAIYHPDPERIGTDLTELEPVRQVVKGYIGTLRTTGTNEKQVVASYAPLPGLPWGLVVTEDWEVLTAPSHVYQRSLVILLALGVALPVLLVALGLRRVTQPIAELTNAAQQVADGHLEQTLQVDSGDELETLAQQFNRMSARLQQSYATLEQRVADRTRELATLNEMAALVSRSLNLDEVLDAALLKTLDTIGLEAGGAFRLDEEEGALFLVAHQGLSEGFVEGARCLSPQASLAGEAAALERPVVREVSAYPEGKLKSLLQAEGFQLVVSVPLTAKGRVLGALNLATRTPRDITPEELSLLAAVGQQTGLAVENARLYEQAEETAVAAERSRLARELHDAVTQTLFSTNLIAEVLPRLWEQNPEQAMRRLGELRELTRGALAEMRALLLELRPSALIEAQMSDLLRQLGESITGRARIPVKVQVEGGCMLEPELKIALYRIAQEALNNVAKHAAAAQASVLLHCEPARVVLTVCDDGQGFDPASIPPNHLGVGIMRERAQTIGAELTIDSRPGQGTQIRVVWGAPSGSELVTAMG